MGFDFFEQCSWWQNVKNIVRDHITAFESEQHWYSLTLLGYKEEAAVCVCVCGSMREVADASFTLPNFKSSVSTLIFSSPALRTQAKTEERETGSFCHSHPSFTSRRCLLLSFYCSPSVFLYNTPTHTYTYPLPPQTHIPILTV